MRLSYVCPYCFAEHKMKDVEFRCKNKVRCGTEVDKRRGDYEGGVSIMDGKCFRADKAPPLGMPQYAKCPHCSEESNVRICPSCHNTLPSTIDKDNELIISLIGTRDSGKSSYVGVLIHELSRRIAGSFDGTFRFMDKEDRRQYEERFGNALYPKPNPDGTQRTPKKLNQTLSTFRAGGGMAKNRPILGTLRLGKKGLLNTKYVDYTFVFFDAAGEDFDDEDVMFVVSSYIAHSDGIIFLLDPFTNSYVRNTVPREVVQAASNIDAGTVSTPTEVIERVADLVRRIKHISSRERIKIPVAAAFSKLDAFENLLPRGAALSRPSPHIQQGQFDTADAFMVSEEMRGLLSAWDEDEFIHSFDSHYANGALFAFSAFGSNPKADGTLNPPLPRRIEDALLWILTQLKVI